MKLRVPTHAHTLSLLMKVLIDTHKKCTVVTRYDIHTEHIVRINSFGPRHAEIQAHSGAKLQPGLQKSGDAVDCK